MDSSYPFRDIEAKWQRAWSDRALVPAEGAPRGRTYIFSWPSSPCPGAGADLSFARLSTFADTVARFRRHQGAAAFLPLAVDGFEGEVPGVARALGKPPASIVLEEAGRLQALARSLGSSHDGRPVSTSEPSYYRFTQWIFLQLYAKGLVFRLELERAVCSRCSRRYRPGAHAACPRCGGELKERKVGEWRLDLRPYGDRLVGDLEGADFPDGVRSVQHALIGRCRGSEVVFPVSRPFELEYQDLTVFTTHVEMIFGVTFLLIDPDHPILEHVLDPAYEEEVTRYRERLRKGAEPTISAARTGGFALNPANLKRIPILVSSLASKPYSEGVVMAVPAHDAELFVLAKRLKLAIREVIHNDRAKFDSQTRLEEPWLGDGIMTNSGSFTSVAAKVGRDRIIAFLARRGVCRRASRYLLRTLALSAESAWGPPVPLLHCKRCGVVPVPDADLPIELPGTQAPDAEAGAPVPPRETPKASCPRCGQTAVRDRETILPWLGTAWSFARLLLPDLAGSVPGFRELEASEPSRALSPTEPAAEAAGISAQPAVPAEAEPPEAGTPSEREAPSAEAQFPEDIDIFDVGSGSTPFGPDDESRGQGPEGEGLEALPAKDPQEPPDPARGEAPLPAEGEAGAPRAAEEDPGAGPPPATASADAPAPDSTRARPEGSREKRRNRGRREEGPPGQERDRGSRRSPADEPETIVLKDVEEDDEEIEDPARKPSPLKPFRSIEAGGLPAALALAPAALSPVHLIGTRFLAKFLKDLWHLPVDEPFARYRPVAGVVSKPQSDGSTATSDLLERFGADALRLYLLFSAPAGNPLVLENGALRPYRRFLDRIWRQMMLRLEKGKFVSRRMLEEKHLLIHLVTSRVSEGKVHTAVAALMRFVRFLESPETAPEDMDRVAMRTFTILLSPFAPHLAEELWSRMGAEGDLAAAAWPIANDELIHPPEREFLILVDGRVRDRMQQPSNLEPEKLESRALQRDRIREIVGNRKVVKAVVVPQRLVNLVLAPAQ